MILFIVTVFGGGESIKTYTIFYAYYDSEQKQIR